MTNIKITKADWYRAIFGKYPQLFSKRGFEKNRIRCYLPKDRDGLAFIIDNKGSKLDVEL